MAPAVRAGQQLRRRLGELGRFAEELVPAALDIDRLDAQHALGQRALLRRGHIDDAALREHARQRHRQRPGQHEVAERALVEDEDVSAEQSARR
jgi:hypothetical protein